MKAPGAHRRCHDEWGSFSTLVQEVSADALFLVDRKVLALHPEVQRALRGRTVIAVRAGERAKSLSQLNSIASRAPTRCSAVVVIGGGTLGDLGTVLAHLIRRGVPLIHVPTTLLAAVDSSVGGKGAVHARANGAWVKNAWGVFHYPERALLCPQLWTTLSRTQRRQGEIEAFKMDVCLDRTALSRWARGAPKGWVERARRQKSAVCAVDPYDSGGQRRVLNFGHTFGHAFESLTDFRLAHGDAVALGMLQALDIGHRRGVTPSALRSAVEATLSTLGAPGRSRLERLLRAHSSAQLRAVVAADKKGATTRGAHMVLLEAVGRASCQWVEWP